MNWIVANLFSDEEQELKCWVNCSDIKWNNLKGNNKYLIITRKLTEIQNSFFFSLSLSLTRNYHIKGDTWYMPFHILSITVTDRYFTGSSMNFHNKQLGNKPSI